MPNRATTAFLPETVPTVSLMGLRLACIDWRGLVDHIFASLGAGCGGWLITANLDFLRRYDHESSSLPFRLHVRPFGRIRRP